MRRLDTLSTGSDRLRLGSWRGDDAVALLSPTAGVAPTPGGLAEALQRVVEQGYRTVITPALTHGEQQPFLRAGFTVHERLHLLRHPLDRIPPPRTPNARLRRGRRGDLDAVLAVDGAAFDSFWRFDRAGLADARSATPSHRFRVAGAHRRVVGYHVTGRAGRLGYLQRLAVDPAHQGGGLGTALVGDALAWCRRHGCRSVLVNTQETNQRALGLYQHLGFTPEPYGLAVLEHPLGRPTPATTP
ncbi:GNAT family N-acetyltransferase [Rhabdothermincola salaria]|uniref:GNAT family N-acetyltransferase n=1 Tax=Rhabdothermincola salaria TaxID=2903142 RepID=UPI001E5181F0|nr:GNAT family N-acetyltransferase [Rhabdothermincola salaria]MCD9624464.1 GNAT family N-acetyltransferase [Rhabdothermincola salaria]